MSNLFWGIVWFFAVGRILIGLAPFVSLKAKRVVQQRYDGRLHHFNRRPP